MSKKLIPVLIVIAASWAAGARAETIYRCGDIYSQAPCPGGKAIQAQDERSTSQRLQSERAVQRDVKAAAELEQARLKEEAKAGPASISTAAAQAPAQQEKPVLAKPKQPPYFTATAKKPGEAPAKKKKKSAPKKKTAPKAA